MRHYTNLKDLLKNAVATGAGAGEKVKDFRHLVLEVSTNDFTGTVKFAGSVSEETPDFDASVGESNAFDFVQTKDLQSGSTIAGDDGIAFTSSTDVRLLEINTNVLTWVNAIVSAYTSGNITVRLVAVND